MLAFALVYVAGGVISLLLGVFLVFTAYIAYVHHKYSHVPSSKLPSFYFGHVLDIVRLRKEHRNQYLPFVPIVEYWMENAKSRTIVVHIFHQARIYTADPEVIKVLGQNVKNDKAKFFKNAYGTLYGERLLHNGLVTVCDYESWKPKRKTYDPSFYKSYLKTLIKGFNSITDDFLDKLKPMADGKTLVPMTKHIYDFVLDVVSKIVFGTDFNKIWDAKSLKLTTCTAASERHTNPLSYIVSKVFTGGGEALVSLWAPWLHYLHPIKAKGYQEAVRAMRMIGRDCIQRRIEAIKRGDEVPQDILTNILKSASLKETQSVEDLVDDFCSFYIGAIDTTANLLLFSIILIHQHPDVLIRLLEEIEDVLGDRTEVTAEDLDKLTYTEQTLNEVHRLHQIIPGVMKELNSAQTIAGIRFPGKTDFLIASAIMNHMPEYHEDPDIFNPDRFSPEKKPSSSIFMPFGLGHRMCIGKHFAMMEAKLLLARILQTYSISLPEGYKLVEVQKTSLQPEGNVPCLLKFVSK